MTDNKYRSVLSIKVGGHTKKELHQALIQANVQLNSHGEDLFDDSRFTVSPKAHPDSVVFAAVIDLGFSSGANLPTIFQKAESIGWQLCPLELAIYLRLQWLRQEKSTNNILHKHEAPQGAVTVASPVIDPDPNHPKGFYLRNIDDQLWLRGYICDDEYVFHPEDQFAFIGGK
ncbi:MAG: hypothetical protein ABF743_02355 [Schleiferilactobacillus perolens]|jgi:hypothetical protein|uniref:hypothetical protein n=1 Tax=Schleiferilactobacillus perolens TaxID=100468 RepID=UPI0039ECC196|nr:hypothetical protein [Schleiferilactobacillus harbinensis]MCI1913847.1 hypothetical protein [Schleiferilactobacillus harbinensis]